MQIIALPAWCVCVCVCVCEREREREKDTPFSFMCFLCAAVYIVRYTVQYEEEQQQVSQTFQGGDIKSTQCHFSIYFMVLTKVSYHDPEYPETF